MPAIDALSAHSRANQRLHYDGDLRATSLPFCSLLCGPARLAQRLLLRAPLLRLPPDITESRIKSPLCLNAKHAHRLFLFASCGVRLLSAAQFRTLPGRVFL